MKILGAAILPAKPKSRATRSAKSSHLFDQLDQNEPKLPPMQDLHRHEDGYVAFAAKNEDDFRPKFAVRASALEQYFPDFRDQLTKDSYVSINASYKTARRLNRAGTVGIPAHSTDNLRYLCACYSDLDFYKHNITFGEAFGKVMMHRTRNASPRHRSWSALAAGCG